MQPITGAEFVARVREAGFFVKTGFIGSEAGTREGPTIDLTRVVLLDLNQESDITAQGLALLEAVPLKSRVKEPEFDHEVKSSDWDGIAYSRIWMRVLKVNRGFYDQVEGLEEASNADLAKLEAIDHRFDLKVVEEFEGDPEIAAKITELVAVKNRTTEIVKDLARRQEGFRREKEGVRMTFGYVAGGREI